MGSLHRGGAETMIMNYYRAFDKSLCQMDFVIHKRFDNDYCAEAASYGAKIILLDRPREIGALKYIKKLFNAIKTNGSYDTIHIHTNYQAFLSIIAAKLAGIKKIVVHSHTTVFAKKYLIINRVVMRLCNVERIGCGELAGKAFFGKSKFTVINNAIDVSKFRNSQNQDHAEIKKERFGEHVVIGHLGRFHPQKNHEFLIEIMKRLVVADKNIVLALYGEGEREQEIRDLVQKAALSDNVLFMGTTNDVITAYKTFDIFVLPSLYEGFPVTLVEAQLSGVKTLASDKISKECDLKVGLLKFLPLNVDEWAERIQEVLKQGNPKAIQISDEILDNYDVNIQWKKLYEIYKK